MENVFELSHNLSSNSNGQPRLRKTAGLTVELQWPAANKLILTLLSL